MSTNKKAVLAIENLLSRQEYMVYQGNDLAKAFGGLSSFEQRVLDYCFSFVKKEDKAREVYEVTALEIIKHFGLNTSGQNYQRIAAAFKRLNENTALYLPVRRDDGTRGIRLTQLFSMIDFYVDGAVRFRFSEDAAPLVFGLTKNFYSFHLWELSRIKGKYTLILLKLWEAKRSGNEVRTTIEAPVSEWQSWFLGTDKKVSNSRFYTSILNRAMEELELKLNIDCFLTSLKSGRKIVSYRLEILDKSKLVNS
ncbi:MULTISPECIES: replication initiation protein [Lactobacillaceae]|nr:MULTISPECIES: replication initiation protein [Lactobacillaceae]MDN6034485.1 replication initiation protein [Lactococcus lactis]MDN6045448.1 replication initiation protein [Lactococcus raffinolactis]KAF0382651.1 RepB family plasmid replication initiator protein [Pediococcus acidilactici]KAF0428229.1 RepB family plasmid replication initiator protein [Pediococcus acidilactici]MBP5810215.1 replication initiation protein [Lactiplantibacillus argentoratensis]